MMSSSRYNIFAIAVVAALAISAMSSPSIAGSEDEAGYGSSQNDGWMMGPGYGSGYGSDYGRGYGPGWMMHRHGGYGPGWMYGYGPSPMGGGYGQHGWMMRRFGSEMGPGMMYGYGPEESEMGLTVDLVKNYLGRMIRNPNLTVGDVKEKSTDIIVADVITKQGNILVQRLDFNRHSGFVKPEQVGSTTGKSSMEPEEQSESKSPREPANQDEKGLK